MCTVELGVPPWLMERGQTLCLWLSAVKAIITYSMPAHKDEENQVRWWAMTLNYPTFGTDSEMSVLISALPFIQFSSVLA